MLISKRYGPSMGAKVGCGPNGTLQDEEEDEKNRQTERQADRQTDRLKS